MIEPRSLRTAAPTTGWDMHPALYRSLSGHLLARTHRRSLDRGQAPGRAIGDSRCELPGTVSRATRDAPYSRPRNSGAARVPRFRRGASTLASGALALYAGLAERRASHRALRLGDGADDGTRNFIARRHHVGASDRQNQGPHRRTALEDPGASSAPGAAAAIAVLAVRSRIDCHFYSGSIAKTAGLHRRSRHGGRLAASSAV